ncbi:unnamed protein product [Gongylonema pulchrum]|uniref:NUC153 domain-containing protein n=1 Tax=Gongylonema pulchrum TaxID=637853 RepID=A0A183D541_9BILA|nr:unnamed protein product [Gongylonema pulchrum]
MVDEAAKKAREEYLKKYLSSDDKSVKKKKPKKRKKDVRMGLQIHEDDAFVAVAPSAQQSSSDDDSVKKEVVCVLEKKMKVQEVPRFRPATFHAVDIKRKHFLVSENCFSVYS